jgi:hypothetical protein
MAATNDENADALARIADQLLDQAADLRRGWDALAAALDDLEVAEPAGAGPAEHAPVDGDAGSDEDPRRLIALNMALGGHSRAATEEYLREQFGDEGIEEILVAVFDA